MQLPIGCKTQDLITFPGFTMNWEINYAINGDVFHLESFYESNYKAICAALFKCDI